MTCYDETPLITCFISYPGLVYIIYGRSFSVDMQLLGINNDLQYTYCMLLFIDY